MTITLTDGETVFEIANGHDRTARVAEFLRGSLAQITQETQRCRALWVTGFPERASRVFDLPVPVVFPSCETHEAALMQAVTVPVSCPRGGVLALASGAESVSFSQAWLSSVTFENLGVRNLFTFSFRVIDPSVTTFSTLAQMDSRYIANLSAITGLTGGGATKLDGLTTTDVSVGFCTFLPALVIGSVATPKMMHLVTGTDAENADPAAGVIIIRPDDYDGSTNAKVWREKL